MSLSDASRDGAFTARAGLRPQQQIEKVKMREALASPRRPPCLMSSPRTPLAALWCLSTRRNNPSSQAHGIGKHRQPGDNGREQEIIEHLSKDLKPAAAF
jgi:hypothetical protein